MASVSKRARSSKHETPAVATPVVAPPPPLIDEKERKRLLRVVNDLNKSRLRELCLHLIQDDQAVPRAIKFLDMPAAGAPSQRCLVCKKQFTELSGCVVEHNIEECARGECSACHGWDAMCGYCTRCGASECEFEGCSREYCYKGVHIVQEDDLPDSVQMWSESEGDDEEPDS